MSDQREQMNVESFNLDHRAVHTPFVKVADVKRLPHDDVLTKYNVRFCQPNVEHLEMPAVHSIEHSFTEYARNHSDVVVDFSPMGCQTGFYLILASEPDIDGTISLISATFQGILRATEIPAANEVQCEWGVHHSLEAAQHAVHSMLKQREV